MSKQDTEKKDSYKLKLNSQGSVIWSLKEEKMYSHKEVREILGLAKIYCDNITYCTGSALKEWFDKNYPQ